MHAVVKHIERPGWRTSQVGEVLMLRHVRCFRQTRHLASLCESLFDNHGGLLTRELQRDISPSFQG